MKIYLQRNKSFWLLPLSKNAKSNNNYWNFSQIMNSISITSINNWKRSKPCSRTICWFPKQWKNFTSWILCKNSKTLPWLFLWILASTFFKRRAHIFAEMLKTLGLEATCLHSKLIQLQRSSNLKKFRNSKKNILVCTDVASRGLDIPTVVIL